MKEENFEAIMKGMEDARRFLAGEEVSGLRYHPARMKTSQ